jgi:hypothetical protein
LHWKLLTHPLVREGALQQEEEEEGVGGGEGGGEGEGGGGGGEGGGGKYLSNKENSRHQDKFAD